MTLLLCLLSDQHVPNLLSIHHFRPDRLVLVESSEMKARSAADNFLAALAAGGLDYTDRVHVQPLSGSNSATAIRSALREAYASQPAGEWIANITGGTKPMSITAYEFFKALGARVVYIDVRQPHELLDFESGASELCEYRLGISEFVRGYGFQLTKSEAKIAEAEERARRWWECACLIARHAVEGTLVRLEATTDEERRKRWQQGRNRGIVLAPGELVIEDEALRASLRDAFELGEANGALVGSLDKHAFRFLTGQWLEVLLWGLLERHAEALQIWDVRLGIEVGRGSGSGDANDLDIAFMHDYSLATVECKTGEQEHDPAADALYKVEAVIRQFRALRVRSYFATTSANVLDRDGAKVKEAVTRRAALYGCRILPRATIRALAEDPDSSDRLREALFSHA
jgi:hypothetical protein